MSGIYFKILQEKEKSGSEQWNMKGKMIIGVETKSWVYRGSLYFSLCLENSIIKFFFDVLGKGGKIIPARGLK